MASSIAVAILLATVCTTFRFSCGRRLPAANYVFNPDNDIYVERQTRGPTDNTKGCNSTPKEDGTIGRKDESEVVYVGPRRNSTELGESGDLQMPDEIGENEIPGITDNRPISECANFRYTVDPLTPDRENEVLRIHTEICKKLSYNPCFLGNITSFELKEDRFEDRLFNVVANHGRILGLANFAANYSFIKRNLKFLLRWKNIRMLFRLTTDEKGNDDVRSVQVHIPLLLMHAHVSNSTLRRIEMSQVNEMEFKSTYFETPSYIAEWAFEDVKHRIREFINKNLRNFIYYSVLEALGSGDDKSTLPFCQGLEDGITVYKDRTNTHSEDKLVFNYS